MTTINITLPEVMRTFVERQAAKEGFGSVSEYMQAVIRDLQKRRAREELDAKLREGLRSPTVRMTDERWVAFEQQVRERSPELDKE
jgi:antitoxin ParD1/3/4